MRLRLPRFASPAKPKPELRERNPPSFAPPAKPKPERKPPGFAKERSVPPSAIYIGFAANALTNFAIQAWMTFGFAKDVWGLPAELSVALVVALDVFAILYMLLTFALRGSGWPRFAAMSVFLFAVGAQVWAAEMFGSHMQWDTELRIFAGLPAVLLALSQEGIILWRTHRAQPAPLPTAPEAPKPGVLASVATRATAPTPAPGPAPAPKPQPTPPARPASTDPDHDDIARRVIARQITKKEAAEEAGKTVKTIENWINAYRARHPQSALDFPATKPYPLPTPVASTQVNGTSPAVKED
jgi:hypothetical protein